MVPSGPAIAPATTGAPKERFHKVCPVVGPEDPDAAWCDADAKASVQPELSGAAGWGSVPVGALAAVVNRGPPSAEARVGPEDEQLAATNAIREPTTYTAGREKYERLRMRRSK